MISIVRKKSSHFFSSPLACSIYFSNPLRHLSSSPFSVLIKPTKARCNFFRFANNSSPSAASTFVKESSPAVKSNFFLTEHRPKSFFNENPAARLACKQLPIAAPFSTLSGPASISGDASSTAAAIVRKKKNPNIPSFHEMSKIPIPTKPLYEGIVQKVVFRFEDTGYTVCKIIVEGKEDEGPHTVVVRSCAKFFEGQVLVFPKMKSDDGKLQVAGKWVRHKRHGPQFMVRTLEAVRSPVHPEAIKAYLCSGAMEGVGAVTAQRLVDAFGTDTLYMIANEPESLSQVKGIGKTTIDRINKAWKIHVAMQAISQFLDKYANEYRYVQAYTKPIFDELGENAVEKLIEVRLRCKSEYIYIYTRLPRT